RTDGAAGCRPPGWRRRCRPRPRSAPPGPRASRAGREARGWGAPRSRTGSCSPRAAASRRCPRAPARTGPAAPRRSADPPPAGPRGAPPARTRAGAAPRRREAALARLRPDPRALVDAVVVELALGVAARPDQGGALDPHPREELRRVGDDELVEADEDALPRRHAHADADPLRQLARH